MFCWKRPQGRRSNRDLLSPPPQHRQRTDSSPPTANPHIPALPSQQLPEDGLQEGNQQLPTVTVGQSQPRRRNHQRSESQGRLLVPHRNFSYSAPGSRRESLATVTVTCPDNALPMLYLLVCIYTSILRFTA